MEFKNFGISILKLEEIMWKWDYAQWCIKAEGTITSLFYLNISLLFLFIWRQNFSTHPYWKMC